MCLAVAVPIHEIPEAMLIEHRLSERIAQRDNGSGREIQFLYRHRRPLLPVQVDGQLRIMDWGSKRGPLPMGGWCHREWIEGGHWQHLRPSKATVLAALALERGVWFQVREGIEAVIVCGRVYLLTEPASHYYRIMTRNQRMPVLVGQTI